MKLKAMLGLTFIMVCNGKAKSICLQTSLEQHHTHFLSHKKYSKDQKNLQEEPHFFCFPKNYLFTQLLDNLFNYFLLHYCIIYSITYLLSYSNCLQTRLAKARKGVNLLSSQNTAVFIINKVELENIFTPFQESQKTVQAQPSR